MSPARIFLLGLACGAALPLALITSARGSTPAPAPPLSWVRGLAETPARVSPTGQATVRLLAAAEDGATGAFLGLLELKSGAAVPPNVDATAELVHVLEGGGVLTLDGVPHTLEVGDTVYMAAGVEASFVARSDGPTRVLQVWAPQGPEAKYAAWSTQERDR